MAEGGVPEIKTMPKDEIAAWFKENGESFNEAMEGLHFFWSGRPTRDWNDDKFSAEYGEKLPTFKVPSIAESFSMALLAYKYWTTGASEPGKDNEILIKVAALMRSPLSHKPSEFMFPWFFSSSANTPLMSSETSEPIRSLEDLSEEVCKAAPMSPGISRFLTTLNTLTDNDLKQMMFINYVSFSALILLRCYLKTEETVRAAFNKRSADKFCDLFEYDRRFIPNLYPPKCDLLKNFCDSHSNLTHEKAFQFTRYMLTASLKVLLEEQGKLRTVRSKVVEFTHLTTLYYHGLRTIPLLYEAAHELSLKPKELNAYLQNISKWKACGAIEKYMANEKLNKKDVTVPFSRLYEERSHADLSIKENVMYCYLLAIIMKNKNPGIFKIAAFKSLHQNQIDSVKWVHQRLMENLKKNAKSTELFVHSRNIGPLNVSRDLYD